MTQPANSNTNHNADQAIGKTILTGIKPTGNPHVGNLGGMILPTLDLIAAHPDARHIVFIADTHALTTVKDKAAMKNNTHEVAATLLALGLDPSKTLIFKQSDIPENFELAVILGNYTAKGLLNRAHAYKAAVDKNLADGNGDADQGISMGLYNYPLLMAADILLYDTDIVPVGKDQIQHVEITRDIAGTFNHAHEAVLTLPEFSVQADAATIPGLDGRKMSKSYGNTIPIFMDSKKMKKLVMKIVTDSKMPEDPKDPDESSIVQLYRFFANPEQVSEMEAAFRQGGMGYGDAKKQLFAAMDAYLNAPREQYTHYMNHTDEIDAILAEGANKARAIAQQTLVRVKQAIGQA